jgi:hypothetical protein
MAALHSAAAEAAASDDTTLVPWSTVEEVLAMAADALRAKQRTVDALLDANRRRAAASSAPVAIAPAPAETTTPTNANNAPSTSLSPSSLDPDSAMRLVRRCERAEEDSADLLAQLEALLAARQQARQRHEELQRLADLLLAERELLAERLVLVSVSAGAKGGRRKQKEVTGAIDEEDEEESDEEDDEEGGGGASTAGRRRKRALDERRRQQQQANGSTSDATAAAPSSLCQAVEALAEEARRARALRGAAAAVLARFSALRLRQGAPSSSAGESEQDARLERELAEALRGMDDNGGPLLPSMRGASPPPLQQQQRANAS